MAGSETRGINSAFLEDDGLIDPANSERQTYRDKGSGLQREIWRPGKTHPSLKASAWLIEKHLGDGDGDQTTDYFERVGPPLPIEKRWRLFQSDIGLISAKNEPPRFVILDDRAAFEVLRSDIQRTKIVQNWPHDFGGAGKVRARRPHRGRAAIKNPGAEGDAQYGSAPLGGKKETYYFSGEKDFDPVNYRYEPPKPEEKRKKRKPTREDEDYNPRAHGHNQYTPKDMLVKHGAPSFSLKEQPEPRVNKFLSRRPSPVQARERVLYGGIAENAHFFVQREALRRQQEFQDLEMQQQEARRRSMGHSRENQAGDESDEEMPIFRSGPKTAKPDHPGISTYVPRIEVPRNMGFIERRALEQKLAAQTVANVITNEDVTRIASELAQADVKVQEQAYQIETLENALLDAKNESSARRLEAESAQARVAELEVKNAGLEDLLAGEENVLQSVESGQHAQEDRLSTA